MIDKAGHYIHLSLYRFREQTEDEHGKDETRHEDRKTNAERIQVAWGDVQLNVFGFILSVK